MLQPNVMLLKAAVLQAHNGHVSDVKHVLRADGSAFLATPVNLVFVLLATFGWQPDQVQDSRSKLITA